MSYTIKEMREEIARIRKANTLTYGSLKALEIGNRRDELMREKGYERVYLNKNEKKQFVDDYLECLINASYDITGTCL